MGDISKLWLFWFLGQGPTAKNRQQKRDSQEKQTTRKNKQRKRYLFGILGVCLPGSLAYGGPQPHISVPLMLTPRGPWALGPYIDVYVLLTPPGSLPYGAPQAQINVYILLSHPGSLAYKRTGSPGPTYMCMYCCPPPGALGVRGPRAPS